MSEDIRQDTNPYIGGEVHKKNWIKDQKVAQEEGIGINKLVDERFPNYHHVKRSLTRKTISEYAVKQSTDALTRQAKRTVENQYDARTGLPNYGLFREKMIDLLQGAFSVGEDGTVWVDKEKLSRINFLVIDIGFLGYANDRFGTSCGDEYKVKSARIAEETSEEFSKQSKSSVITYAMSEGDEMVLVADCSTSDLQIVGDVIEREISKIQIDPQSQLPAGAGKGIASCSDCIDEFLEFEKKNYKDHKEVYERYLYIMEGIADLGHQMDKNIQRLALYRNLVFNPKKFGGTQDDEFLRLKTYILKNSIEVSNEEFEGLVSDPPDLSQTLIPPLVDEGEFIRRAKLFIKRVQTQRKENTLKRATSPLKMFAIAQQLKMIDSRYI